MSWLNLERKVAIVTGGASGIGKEIAIKLAKEGVGVVIADINQKTASKVMKELKGISCGIKHSFVKVDIADIASIRKMVKDTLKNYGEIDILINNAGINIPRLLVDPEGKEEITDDLWNKMVTINQKGSYFCAQAVAREMVKKGNGGVIINIASESALEGSEGQSVYAGTKAALYSYTRSLAKELGKYNIRVVGVAPGILEDTALRTEEYESSLAYTRGISVEELKKGYEKVSIPLRRVGKLEEVADTVCFLASEKAGYVTGTILNISGGKSRA